MSAVKDVGYDAWAWSSARPVPSHTTYGAAGTMLPEGAPPRGGPGRLRISVCLKKRLQRPMILNGEKMETRSPWRVPQIIFLEADPAADRPGGLLDT